MDLADSLHNVNVAFYGGFSESPEFAVRQIYPLDVRIILGILTERQARSTLCQVKQHKCSFWMGIAVQYPVILDESVLYLEE